MRTTIRLDDELLTEAKRYAAQTGRTLTSLVDQGLREVLFQAGQRVPTKRVELLTSGKGGLQPGVKVGSFNHL